MFSRSRKHKERLLLCCHFDFIAVGCFKVIYLCLSKDETFVLDCSFLKSDSPGHILDMLHDEVHRNSIISESWDNDIRIDNVWQDKIPESIFDKLIVLLEHTNY